MTEAPHSAVERAAVSDPDATPHAVLFDHETPRVVRLEREAGESVPEHDHPDAIVVIALLADELVVRLDGREYSLTRGELLRFDGEHRVEPRALDDVTALVVLASK